MKNARVFLCGSGRLMKEKLEKLLSFEAKIVLFTESGAEVFSHPQVQLRRRKLCEEDLAEKPLFVVAAEEDCEENRRISAMCKVKNIPVNVVDVPSLCSFYFPALIRRGEVTLSVSTGGTSPMAASVLRKRLEEAVPSRLEEIIDWSAELKKKLLTEISDPQERKRILRKAVSLAMEEDHILSDEEVKLL